MARLACVGLGGALLIVALIAGSVVRGTRPIEGPVGEGAWTARSRGWFKTRGFYPAELELRESRHFAWTRTDGALVVPLLDRRDPYVLRLQVRGIAPRPDRAAQELRLSVDGVLLQEVVLTGKPQTLTVPIPAARSTLATVTFKLSHGFVPGPNDPRELGMIVDDVALASVEGPIHLPARGLAASGAVGACLAFALVLIGAPWPWTVALAIIASGGHAYLLSLDGVLLGDEYVWRLLWTAAGLLLAGACCRALMRMRPALLDTGSRTVLAVVLVVLALRLAVFVHPSITVGDSIFQVHRAELVHRGTYYFTSVTPRPFFEFPYAPGLYVAAMPLWASFPTTPDRVRLLRTIVLVVDALAALALFGGVRRYWGTRPALAAAAFYQLVPIGFHTVCTSNLTNAFGQSVFTSALMLACGLLGRIQPLLWSMGLAALLATAFLSHFSTLSTGVPIVVAGALALAWKREERHTAWWMALALATSLTVSYVIYYSHFHHVYQQTIERVLAQDGEAPARSMVAPVTAKLHRFVYAVRFEYFGLPLVGAALAGIGLLIVRRTGDAWTRVLAGWLIVVLAFFALGILTPIEMRASLAVQPLVAALGGLTAAALWETNHRLGRVVSLALVGAVLWRGLSDWLLCLGVIRPG